METGIQIFQNEQFGKVRIAMSEDNEPLFCLVDVCKAVNLTNPSSVKLRLEKEDVQLVDLHTLKQTEGVIIGNSMANFITESGFYDVLLYSDAPQVKPFRKWVTNEVLPSIRKHGVYFTPEKIEEVLNDPDTIIRLATTLKEEKQKRAEAEKHVMILTHTNKTYTATEIAKEIGMKSANELNKWLEEKKVQYKVNGTWVPCSGYSDRAWFEIKQEELDNGHIIYHRKITGIGRDGILSLCRI
jgi:prophage antirepressor-like protein|nr:MAG TPA: repressor domain protein [Caudoviricetes sp.]